MNIQGHPLQGLLAQNGTRRTTLLLSAPVGGNILPRLRKRVQGRPIMPPDAAQASLPLTLPKATYTVAQAAAILGIPRRSLYIYIAQGVVPAVHVGRRKLLILKSTIDQLLATGAYPPTEF